MAEDSKKTKYDEICLIYRRSRRTFLEYKEECQEFARDLIDGMIEYFEWPHHQEITFITLDEEIDPSNRFYAISAAMQMDAEDFWHFGLELVVTEPGGSYPLPFVMSFFIKKTGPLFIVKLGPAGKEIKIHEDRRRELAPFYDAVFVQIMSFFTQKYQDAITKGLSEPDFVMLLPQTET